MSLKLRRLVSGLIVTESVQINGHTTKAKDSSIYGLSESRLEEKRPSVNTSIDKTYD
jgi:hypothetical protein